MMDLLIALVIPLLLMVVVTRVTFSIIGACIVTWMVCLFALGMHQQPWYVGVIAIVSFFVGLWLSKKVLRKRPGM